MTDAQQAVIDSIVEKAKDEIAENNIVENSLTRFQQLVKNRERLMKMYGYLESLSEMDKDINPDVYIELLQAQKHVLQACRAYQPEGDALASFLRGVIDDDK